MQASRWGKAGVLNRGGFALAGLQGWWVPPRSYTPFLALRVLLYLAWAVGARPPPPHSPPLTFTSPFWDMGPVGIFPSLRLVYCFPDGVFGKQKVL